MSSADVRPRRRSDGRWEVRPYLGTDRLTGRAIRPYRSWPADTPEDEVMADFDRWMAAVAPAAASGASRRLDSMLLAYVTDPARGFSGNTVATYESAIRCYVTPTLGAISYDELRPLEVEGAYRVLLTPRPGAQPISRSTLRKVHALLSGAYRSWQKQLLRNPMLDVPAPTPEAVAPVSLDEWDVDGLLPAIGDGMSETGSDRASILRRATATAAFLALNAGLRCGEICALRRRDWRRATHDVHVGSTMVEKPRLMRQAAPKRGSSGNVAVAPEVERALADLVAWQDGWVRAPGPDTALLADGPDGSCPRPSEVSRRFTALAKSAGMPEGTTMHTLRHTHATWLLMNGYDMRTIQERLRHADVATTLRLYATVMPGRDADAAAAFSSAHAGRER